MNATTTKTVDTTKSFECTDCGSAAIMHTNPALWPGLWECTNEDCGLCDYCTHENKHTETDENDYGQTVSFYICDDCEQEVPDDPAADAYDFQVELAIAESLGK